MEPENQNAQEPVVSQDEMKMPEESFIGEPTQSGETTHLAIIIGVLIVVLVLILGGLYLWGSTLQTIPTETVDTVRPTAEENNEPESTNAEAEVETLQAVSTSNEIGAIEADIESTNLDELDAELEAIDAELESALNSI